jgi:hypothetical protein
MSVNKDEALDTLKALLLEDDRRLQSNIEQHLTDLEQNYLNEQSFSQKVDERTDKKIAHLKQHFGVTFKNELKAAIQYELKNSQDEVINSLYPIIGKLIGKFIKAEFEKIAEQLDARVKDTFSIEIWNRRIKAFFSGNDSSAILLSEINKPKVIEVFVIQNGSGLLIGDDSLDDKATDRDMVAGLLTAIKAFAEDAFSKNHETLSTIEYENMKLIVQTYHTLTVAFVVTGIVNNEFKEKLKMLADDFLEQLLSKVSTKEIDSELQALIKRGIRNFFLEKPIM